MATSLIVPVAYITVLVTALAIFSRVYRKRKAAEARAYEPWFPTHPTRDIYMTLLSAPSPVPDSLLKSALLTRTAADVKRIWRLREDKMALTNLHQRGLVGDETMARFEAAEKELEAEIVDVVQEANTFRQGWGGMIFATATEMAQAERTREVVMNIPKIKAEEDKRQARRKRYLPEAEPTQPALGSSASAQTIKSGNTTPPTTSTPSATNSAGVSRSASPGPEAARAAPAGTSSGASTPAGTPSKATPSKKKKGKK